MSQYIKFTLLVLLTSLLGASCRVTDRYQTPPLTTDRLYRDITTADTTTIASLPWNGLFTDPVLQDLIRKGIAQNLDLKTAYTRIEQAQAYYLQTGAALLPILNANLGYTTSKLSEAEGFGIRTRAQQYQIGLSSSWEVDIWGKLRSNRRANLANLFQSQAAARTVQTGLVASIASYYYQLLALDQQLIITQETVSNWDTTVQTMRELKTAALVTEAAVVQSEAQRYAAEVTIPDLKQRIRETENVLSTLLGLPPAAINRSTLADQQPIENLQTGVPAQLLSNRPDVQQAEYNFRYYYELTNVARTYFYPSLVITGSAGLTSLTFANWFDPVSLAARIGGSLVQPIFNQRTNRTRLEVAHAQQQAALLDFQQTLLFAGQEVSNALFLHQTALEKMSIRSSQLTALQRSVEYSNELLRNGFAIYPEVITARQSLLQAELGAVNDRLQQLQAIVNLYRSLGGGWR